MRDLQRTLMAKSAGILGDGTKAVKIHHLIKAPENTSESISLESHGMLADQSQYTRHQKSSQMEPLVQLPLLSSELKGVPGGGSLDALSVVISMTLGMTFLQMICFLSGSLLKNQQIILRVVK